ncbi:unnamed protein product, partial [Pocillopora meandrina]
IETTDKWYQHEPETVMHNKDNNITIIWDMPVNTEKKHRSEGNGEEKQVKVLRIGNTENVAYENRGDPSYGKQEGL